MFSDFLFSVYTARRNKVEICLLTTHIRIVEPRQLWKKRLLAKRGPVFSTESITWTFEIHKRSFLLLTQIHHQFLWLGEKAQCLTNNSGPQQCCPSDSGQRSGGATGLRVRGWKQDWKIAETSWHQEPRLTLPTISPLSQNPNQSLPVTNCWEWRSRSRS